jgi:hydroxymethylpyrimidine/phosphomethylpyrimidine kinase
LCSIAGSDPTGGAGTTADLETFRAHGCAGVAVVTATTRQGRAGVEAVEARAADAVARDLEAALASGEVAAVKVGMLATAAIARAVARGLAGRFRGPVVLDPVLAAGAGGRLLEEGALPALEDLARRATLVTPNLPEAREILGPGGDAAADPEALARALSARWGGVAVLLKGGHAAGPLVLDLLLADGRATAHEHPRIPGPPLHGTGCTLASAVAARLARGEPLPEAVGGAIRYLVAAIEATRAAGGWRLRRPPAAPPPDRSPPLPPPGSQE